MKSKLIVLLAVLFQATAIHSAIADAELTDADRATIRRYLTQDSTNLKEADRARANKLLQNFSITATKLETIDALRLTDPNRVYPTLGMHATRLLGLFAEACNNDGLDAMAELGADATLIAGAASEARPDGEIERKNLNLDHIVDLKIDFLNQQITQMCESPVMEEGQGFVLQLGPKRITGADRSRLERIRDAQIEIKKQQVKQCQTTKVKAVAMIRQAQLRKAIELREKLLEQIATIGRSLKLIEAQIEDTNASLKKSNEELRALEPKVQPKQNSAK